MLSYFPPRPYGKSIARVDERVGFIHEESNPGKIMYSVGDSGIDVGGSLT